MSNPADLRRLVAVEADLVRVEPAKRCFRFYHLAIWPDLFGGVSLVREWGRLGSPGKLRLDPHADEAQAHKALVRLARVKRHRGYREVTPMLP